MAALSSQITMKDATFSHSATMPSKRCRLLELSDELLVLVITQSSDVSALRACCKKLRNIIEPYRHRGLTLMFKEDPKKENLSDLFSMPQPYLRHLRDLAILNQPRIPGGYFYFRTISRPHSYRLYRWQFLEDASRQLNDSFSKTAFLMGVNFYWNLKLAENQLTSFAWRHAVPLALDTLQKIVVHHSQSLESINISMVQPPTERLVKTLRAALKETSFPKLKTLTYHGLSHTEPIPQNLPEPGGRFRMVRPLFRKTIDNHNRSVLQELTLSQDHCISQIGKTPLINGRTFGAYLCDLDQLLIAPCPHKDNKKIDYATLHLYTLELGGFKVSSLCDIPDMPTHSPRVRVDLSSLKRLVLNECDGLVQLLRELKNRADEVTLIELGLRIYEDEDAYENFGALEDALSQFLTSFRGLRLVSVLWDGKHHVPQDLINSVAHHRDTIEAYTFVNRHKNLGDDEFSDLRFVSMPHDSRAVLPFGIGNLPHLREIAIQLPEKLGEEDYSTLRILSQLSLRTVHVRNFPILPRAMDPEYWRDSRGEVTESAIEHAAQYAEYISSPFEMEDLPMFRDDDSDDKARKSDWQKVVNFHASRNKGVSKPSLRLLIIGDWRYRDQENLTGPRSWDPHPWAASYGPDIEEEMDTEDEDAVVYSHGSTQFQLRHGFRNEWDLSLLPIFFQINWRQAEDEDENPRWKAYPTPIGDALHRSRWRHMQDVNLLDFAFQN